MNNTKNILLIAIITATLILGTSVIPMQSYADKDDDDDDEDKKTKDHISHEDKSDAKLHLDQDNTCYRSAECKQGNEGQQVVGNDNDVTGFNDQSDNLPTNLPGTGTDNGNETGSPITPPPVNGACSSDEVRVTVAIGAGIQANGCISSSIVGLLQSLPLAVSGQCTGSLVPATLTIGNGTPITVCVPPHIHI
jgi:hypothetical protein